MTARRVATVLGATLLLMVPPYPAAQAAGLGPGDVITAIDGRTLKDSDSRAAGLGLAVRLLRYGVREGTTTISVQVWRRGVDLKRDLHLRKMYRPARS